MSQTARIRRGSAAARPRAGAVAAKPKAAVRKAETRVSSLMAVLPISPTTSRRLVRWGMLALILMLLVVLASAFKLPQMAGVAAGEALGRAGFTLKRVEPRGIRRMDRLAVYDVAFDQESAAMPLIDLAATRERLMQFGWVKEARVSRRLPDTLVIDIVERQPAAVWQNRGKLSLIDRDGVVLDNVALDKLPDLPLVIGPAANLHASALNRLLEGVPTLKPMLAGATWIGGRRWDIRFQSGEVLALPEGEPAAKKALVKFTRMDAAAGLLGQGLVRFDMRDPKKMYVRMSSEPGKRVQVDPSGKVI